MFQNSLSRSRGGINTGPRPDGLSFLSEDRSAFLPSFFLSFACQSFPRSYQSFFLTFACQSFPRSCQSFPRSCQSLPCSRLSPARVLPARASAMFFNLCHPRLPVPLLIAISSDGRPFLRAKDVARVLGSEDLRRLRRPGEKRAHLRVRDVVRKKKGLPGSALKTRIFSVEKTLDLLRDCGDRPARMIKFWLRNPEVPRVSPVGPGRVGPCVDRRRAGHVKIGVEDYRNSPSFLEFLDEFARATAEMRRTAAARE